MQGNVWVCGQLCDIQPPKIRGLGQRLGNLQSHKKPPLHARVTGAIPLGAWIHAGPSDLSGRKVNDGKIEFNSKDFGWFLGCPKTVGGGLKFANRVLLTTMNRSQ